MDKPSRLIDREPHDGSSWLEYLEVVGVIALVTVAGWFSKLDYHALGQIYLLAVVLLAVRVGRWPVLFSAIVSAVTWNFLFIPPRWSLTILNFNDTMLLLSYLAVALMAGQFTARIRAQERYAHLRERQATALFHLTRALAGARTLDEAVEAALRQADGLFKARTALLIADDGVLQSHPAGSFQLDETDRRVSEWVQRHGREAGRFTDEQVAAEALHLPLLRSDVGLGVLAIRLPAEVTRLAADQWELMEGFAAQIALLVEREQLRAASEREKFFAESTRLQRALLDSVSHELKTPLAVLRSAGDKLHTEDAAKRSALTAEMRTATRRLDHLVANLLNQSRLESGALSVRPDWCEVRDILNAARRAMGEALNDRPLTISVPEDMPLLWGDEPLLEQVVANLLSNAVRHTPPATEICVSAGRTSTEGKEQVFIRVADRGPGIPPELRENLFEKFHRYRETRPGGLGLGLSIVRGFVRAHQGEVVAENHPGGGACFTVFLPHAWPAEIPADEL